MKLSEAIRKGSELRPQGFGTFFQARDFDVDRGVYARASCALGAAYEAVIPDEIDEADIGQKPNDEIEFELRDEFPLLDLSNVQCPDPDCITFYMQHYGTLYNVVAVLNDTHHWTRERIADWVATIEATNV